MTSAKKVKDIWLAQFQPARKDDLPFEILQTQTLDSTRALSINATQHTFYIIHWLEQGSGVYHIDFQGHSIQPKSLYFLTPGQVHSWDVQERVSGYTLFFTEEFLEIPQPGLLHQVDFFHRFDQVPVVQVSPENVKLIDGLIQQLFVEYRQDQTGRAIVLQSLLQLLLVQAQREYHAVNHSKLATKSTAGAVLTRDFKYLVGQHFLTMRTVEAYAEKLHVNSSHLSDTVKRLTGLPPGAHIRQRLALEAKRLLAHTDLTAQQITYQLGFEDPSYFGRFFKREVGVGPQTFRDQTRGKYQNS
jgi:AraC family transcriptional regulator, transcriptional activator of pobA